MMHRASQLRGAVRPLSTRHFLPLMGGSRHLSTATPLHLRYINGVCSLPVPQYGTSDSSASSGPPKVFKATEDMTLAAFAAKIKADAGPNQPQVAFHSVNEEQLPDSSTVKELAVEDFNLVIDGRKHPVTVPFSTDSSASSPLVRSGDMDFHYLSMHSSITKLREILEAHPKWKITYTEYEKLCEEAGIQKSQAKLTSRNLHQLGILFHFDQSEDSSIRNTVFLKPASIIDMYFNNLKVATPSEMFMDRKKKEILANLEAIKGEYETLKSLKEEITDHAKRRADIVSSTASVGMVGFFGLYWWLSFVYLSWDIMEPMTYFTGFGVTIGGYFWWMLTNKDYEYENVYDWIVKRNQQKGYAKRNLDLTRFAELQELRDYYTTQIESLSDIQTNDPPFLHHTLLNQKGFHNDL